MYRSELSGVLGGLTRVRAIQLNDAHIFCTLDQVGGRGARRALELIGRAYAGARHPRRPLPAVPARGRAASTSPTRRCGERATALLQRGAGRLGP